MTMGPMRAYRQVVKKYSGVAADVYRPRTHNTCEGCKNASLQINKTQEQLSSNSGCL